ncbi:MAG: glycosyltransferase [Candidatus Microthrix sp.]|nr:glycosyltransferase [Candidatus Microthrix sp.]
MRVLHVIDSLGVGGGAEHSLAKMLPLLRSRGVHSSLAVLIPREGGLQQQLREMGFPLHVIEGRSWPAKVLDLRKLIDSSHPDLVHATLYYSGLASRLATAFTSVPLINSRVSTSYDPARTMHNATSSWKLRLVRSADQITARPMVDHIHAVTDEVAEEATRVLRFPPARITVVKRGRSSRSRRILRRAAERHTTTARDCRRCDGTSQRRAAGSRQGSRNAGAGI